METKGKYVIVYLIKGEARKYQESLTRRISQEYGIPDLSEAISPHITLKYFNQFIGRREIEGLEKLLLEFCKNNRRVKLKLNGIGHFGNQVIFTKVEPSEEMVQLYKELTEELDRLGWVTWTEYEKANVHFHATLAEKRVEDRFEDIFQGLKDEKPCFELELDNIAILTKPKDKWVVYREFSIRG